VKKYVRSCPVGQFVVRRNSEGGSGAVYYDERKMMEEIPHTMVELELEAGDVDDDFYHEPTSSLRGSSYVAAFSCVRAYRCNRISNLSLI